MHQKSKLHFIECLHHRHLAYVRAKTHTATITSRRIYKKIKAIPFLFFLGHIEVQTAQEGCPIRAQQKSAPSQIPNGSSNVNVLGYHRMRKIESNKSLSSDFRFDQSERSYGRKTELSPCSDAFSQISRKRQKIEAF